MKNLTYIIEESVFKIFPDFSRAILFCEDFTNKKNQGVKFEGITDIIPFTNDTISTTPSVVNWRKAFRVMGIDPTKDRVSFEGLTRRCINTGFIKNINYLVDLGNYISVKYQCPVGVHPLDGLDKQITLKEATGKERFIPLGGVDVEHPQQGEIILTSGNNVLTRRFCWRQGVNSIVTEATSNFFVNFDFLNKDEENGINAVIKEFSNQLFRVSPGSTIKTGILNAKNSSYKFEINNH